MRCGIVEEKSPTRRDFVSGASRRTVIYTVKANERAADVNGFQKVEVAKNTIPADQPIKAPTIGKYCVDLPNQTGSCPFWKRNNFQLESEKNFRDLWNSSFRCNEPTQAGTGILVKKATAVKNARSGLCGGSFSSELISY
jgi:predicted phage tail protein